MAGNELELERLRLRMAWQSAGDALIALDPQGRIAMLNPAAERLFRTSESAARGHLLRDHCRLFREDGDLAEIDPRAGAADDQGPSPWTNFLQVQIPQAAAFLAEVTFSAAPSADGKDFSMVLALRDLAERRPIRDAQQALADPQESLSRLLHHAPSILWSAAPDGSLTWINERWREYTGLSAQENVTDWAQVLHPDDRARWARSWAEALRDGSEYAIEVRKRCRDGAYHWFLTRAAAARDSAGKITDWFGSSTEIHQFKLSEEARRESQRRLRFALESAAIGEWEVDLVTGRGHTSPEHDRCFGADGRLENWSVEKFFTYVHPDDQDQVRRQIRADHEARQDCHFQCRVIWPDSTVHWIDAHSTIYLSPDGTPSHVAGIVRDITGRKQSAESLREAYRHRDQFLANISHELRSPMASLMGFAELLSTRLKDPTDRRYAAIIKNSGDHLLALINDLLDLAKMEAGKLEIAPEPVALGALLNEVRALMESRASEKGLNFSMRFEGSLPETILLDPTRLRQVLINLIGNAIKFTEDGRVELVARFDSARSLLDLEVIDTGIGIAADAQRRMFEPFTQFAMTPALREGGSGLGLSITRRLVGLMGGEIACESELGKGSRFRVILPAEVCAAESSVVPAPVPDGQPIAARVLAVDDREEFRYLLRLYLEGAGAEVLLAGDGQAALEAVRQSEREGRPFTAVILDMQMPVLDGYETARRLRAQGVSVPIIALTASSYDQDVQKCYSAGCDAHLSKPIKPARLLETVRHWSGVRRAPSGPGTGAGKILNILLIDDNRVTCKSMGMLLEMAGHHVRLAHDGRSALASAQEFHPDVVVSDIKLPDMDGFGLLSALQNLGGMEQTKFIALSGYPESEFRDQKVKFHHFLHKPVKVEDLETLLKRN